MSYLCLNCYKVYKNKPKKNCCSNAIEIDDFMIPSIVLLNQKGYKTEFCCSGHIYDDVCCPYISFDSSFNNVLSEENFKNIFQNLPSPWHIEHDNGMSYDDNHVTRRTLRYDYLFGKDMVTTQNFINDANVKLLNYINTLPSLIDDN